METEKKGIDRRTFLKATGIGGASLALSMGVPKGIPFSEAADNSISKKMPTRPLGKTGASMPILGMGGDVDYTLNHSLLKMSLNMGVNYWDTSHLYENGKSELGIGQYFEKYPEDRKKVFLVSKPTDKFDPKGMEERLNLSFERLHTDYIDLYFMHNLQSLDLLTPEVKTWAGQKKKEGKIRFFGYSFHMDMARMLMHAPTLGWVDAVMSTYNYQVINDDDIRRGLDACAKAGIGVIAIKTQGALFQQPPAEGSNMLRGQGEPPQGPPPNMQSQRIANESEDLSAMRHFMDKGYTLEQAKLKVVWENENITAIASLMSNFSLLKSNVAAAVDDVPLSAVDRKVLDDLAAANSHYYCRGCMRCRTVMGADSRIPDVLRYMMYYNSYGRTDDAKSFFGELPEQVRLELPLKDYSVAERFCPNKIEIAKAMRKAAGLLG